MSAWSRTSLKYPPNPSPVQGAVARGREAPDSRVLHPLQFINAIIKNGRHESFSSRFCTRPVTSAQARFAPDRAALAGTCPLTAPGNGAATGPCNDGSAVVSGTEPTGGKQVPGKPKWIDKTVATLNHSKFDTVGRL